MLDPMRPRSPTCVTNEQQAADCGHVGNSDDPRGGASPSVFARLTCSVAYARIPRFPDPTADVAAPHLHWRRGAALRRPLHACGAEEPGMDAGLWAAHRPLTKLTPPSPLPPPLTGFSRKCTLTRRTAPTPSARTSRRARTTIPTVPASALMMWRTFLCSKDAARARAGRRSTFHLPHFSF